MAISATFYKHNKRVNSTLRPTPSADDITLSVELKDVCNLYTPSLVISTDVFMSGGQIVNPMRYNYCYLPDFERYYFIRSWSWIVGRWECALEVDVMATFKTQIGNSSMYVLRSTAQCDPDIVDTKYPVKAAGADTAYQDASYGSVYNVWNTNIYGNNVSDGFFRVSIVNNDSSAIGSVSHYAISGRVMAELMNKLYSSPSWANITDANISTDLQKMLLNPMQYITSVIWIPTGYNTTGQTAIHTIPYGWWSITLTGDVYRITTGTMAKSVTESIPVKHHPQYDIYKHWLQLSPYTTAALYFTPFGFIPIDTSKIYDATHVDIEVRVDIITGKGTLILSSHKTVGGTTTYGGTFYTTTAQVGIPMTIAQMAVDMSALGQASTWVGAAGLALAAGGMQESLAQMKNDLMQGAQDFFANLSSSGQFDPTAPFVDPNTGALLAAPNAQQIGRGVANAISAVSRGVNNAGSSAASTARGNSLLSSLKQIASDIGSAALACAGTCSSSGSSGGFAALSELLYIQWYFQKVVADDPTHYGRPLCKTVQISSLSGFVLCGNTDSFTASCTPAERQAVCGIMEAGFYYE